MDQLKFWLKVLWPPCIGILLILLIPSDSFFKYGLGYFVAVVPYFLYILIKHHSKKTDPLLVGQRMNLQKNIAVYFLSWFVIALFSILLLATFFPGGNIEGIMALISLILAPLLALSLPLLLIILGVKSIVEKTAIYYQYYLTPRFEKSSILSIVWGLFYIALGIVLFSMEASLFGAVYCDAKTNLFCSFINILKLPFESLDNPFIGAVIKWSTPILIVFSFVVVKLKEMNNK